MKSIKKQVELDIKIREANTKIYYLDRMVEEIQRGYFCIFAGAGLSAASGYVDWKTLLEPMGKQLGLNMNMDLTLLAQYYENEFTRDELNRQILEEFAKIPKSNANMEILASMPIHRYWTTNYDSIIEDTLKLQGKIVDVVINQLQFKYHSPKRDAIVLKMHGDKTLPDTAVLCKNDYENYDEQRAIFTQSLTLDLISNTFLFIGFSFSDPNLDRIIAIVKRNFKGASPKKHYCFLRSINLEDYLKNYSNDTKAKEEFEQDCNAQECKIRDMRRYGIETILIDDFDQITQMLKYMRDKINLNSVFIAGATKSDSPSDYGEFQKKSEGKLGKAEKFIMNLADELIMNQYNLVTGFGVGVGNYLIAGAYTQREGKSDIKLDERVYIQPMISTDDNDMQIKTQIRENLLKRCGIVLTIFGKSQEDAEDSQIENDGTFIEYKLASQSGKIIIPIGATGFTSRIIYDREKKNWPMDSKIYENLGDTHADNNTLIKNIIKGIEYLKNKHEEEMQKALVKNLFEPAEKKKMLRKAFISFHYSSSYIHINKIVNIIQNTDKYWISKEIEKCEDTMIQQWIDEKMSDIVVTIILFNKQFSDSKWTDYEVTKTTNNNIPILFLTKKDDDVSVELKSYIKGKKIKKYDIFEWNTEDDFNTIPQQLDDLLEDK